MRKAILILSLLATTSSPAWSAMPVFHQSNSTKSVAQPKQSGGNWITRMWRSNPKPADPQFFYQAPTPPPTTTERITSAITDNAAVRTARNWIPTGESKPPQQVDPISLVQPVGKPTPDLLLSMAQIQEGEKNIEGAREFYFKALAANPKNVQTLREIGHFEDRQNRLVEAERYYAQAVQFEPQNAAALNDLALCLARQEKFGASAQVLERAIALSPTKKLYRNNMATVLMQVGEQHRAMHHLMAVHSHAVAYYNMGHLLEKREQSEAAQAHYAEALRLDPAMQPAENALARFTPTPPSVDVPQTAMVPQETPTASVSPESEWPSTPISPGTNSTSSSSSRQPEPEFGPQLLPPLE